MTRPSPLITVAETARAYCAIVAEEGATATEMVTSQWVHRQVDVRRRRELAYVHLWYALRAAGYPVPEPVIDESPRLVAVRAAEYGALENARAALGEMRRIASNQPLPYRRMTVEQQVARAW